MFWDAKFEKKIVIPENSGSKKQNKKEENRTFFDSKL